MTFIVPIKVHCLLTSNQKQQILKVVWSFSMAKSVQWRKKFWVAHKLVYNVVDMFLKKNVVDMYQSKRGYTAII